MPEGKCCSHCLECPLPCVGLKLPFNIQAFAQISSVHGSAPIFSPTLPYDFPTCTFLFSKSVAQPCHYLLTGDSSTKLNPKLLAQCVAHNSCLVAVDETQWSVSSSSSVTEPLNIRANPASVRWADVSLRK